LHVAAAIHYLAEEQIVHLDVKPDNIVMGVPPRLIDLSVARSHERAARLSGAVGTDAYMAPEQCDAGAYPGCIGAAADVWGLGATLFHALAGEVPFPRPKGARASEDRREVVLDALAKDPAERPSAAGMAEALEPLVAGLPRRLTLARRGTSFS
jgi:serine/threonine protein kinase